MNKFIGVKIITAKPMMLNDAENHLSRKIQTLNDDGYLVRYDDGYESWSPKKVFEDAYRQTSGLTFGLAIEAMKKGEKVSRSGWNGKGMYLSYKAGYPEGVPANESHAKSHKCKEGDIIKYMPYIEMKTVDYSFIPWLASQADMLSDDWQIVE